ncbi:MAG TPA: hypothetical protein EYN90_00055 [Acidobacteria bacterium]|nr:hypothetical protein [Acidobacteriota bacterium]HIN69714.1 hypothetical protein [Acidobacteriota bacterium]
MLHFEDFVSRTEAIGTGGRHSTPWAGVGGTSRAWCCSSRGVGAVWPATVYLRSTTRACGVVDATGIPCARWIVCNRHSWCADRYCLDARRPSLCA